jgi:hypothetical protein
MMKPLVFSLLLALGAQPAAAHDMLPLKRGIYVDASKRCKGASRADTLSYWGGDNGINVAQVACKIERLENKGDIFTLQRVCQPIDSTQTFKDLWQLKILGRFSFIIGRDQSSRPSGPVFRYCGAKVIF